VAPMLHSGLAFGTQTAGSIIRPAAFCGVVGFKPSFGAIPRAGAKLLAHSLDTVGVMARSVDNVTTPFRRFLHHEAQRHRDGTVDLPVYHHCSRGPAVGRGEIDRSDDPLLHRIFRRSDTLLIWRKGETDRSAVGNHNSQAL
jgi:hypothetical protein